MTESRPNVHEISDRYVEQTATLDPLTATYLGIRGQDELMTDFGPDGWAARASSARSAITAVTAAGARTDRDRVAAEQLRERLEVSLDLYDAGHLDTDLNTAESPPQWIRQTFDLMGTDTEADWAVIATRMGAVPLRAGDLPDQPDRGRPYRPGVRPAAGAGLRRAGPLGVGDDIEAAIAVLDEDPARQLRGADALQCIY